MRFKTKKIVCVCDITVDIFGAKEWCEEGL